MDIGYYLGPSVFTLRCVQRTPSRIVVNDGNLFIKYQPELLHLAWYQRQHVDDKTVTSNFYLRVLFTHKTVVVKHKAVHRRHSPR